MTQVEFEATCWGLLGALYFNLALLAILYEGLPELLPLWLICLGAAALMAKVDVLKKGDK